MHTPFALASAAVLAAGCAAIRPHPVIDESRTIDLTYAFNDETIYWPTAPKFELEEAAHGINDAGWWYASNNLCASEHGGTHIDAPIHFDEHGMTTAEIPLSRLIGPVRVVDIRHRCAAERNYRLVPADIERHEAAYGRIDPGTIVLIHTGYGKYYPNAAEYLGSAVRGRVENLSFPGIGADAARLLVERRIDMVGLDTASLDYGASTDFIAHRILNGANIPGLENVANLERVPPVGATLVALPMKIEQGTGGPCRIIAILPPG